jgi:hypothetical protein
MFAAHNLELTSVAMQLPTAAGDVERCDGRSANVIVMEG